MKWRKWFRIIHRDVGYFAFGLTVIYAISGVAVNHVHHWNPNYSIENTSDVFDEIMSFSELPDSAIIGKIIILLGEDKEFKSSFRSGPQSMEIFLEGNTISVNFASGEIKQEIITSRAVLKEMNFLHLNTPKKIWTYVADLFALALIVLAVTGIFMIKGSKGISGRGAWMTALGILLPIIFLLLYWN